jgi:Plasmid pRiA4b ORF-3-like protein
VAYARSDGSGRRLSVHIALRGVSPKIWRRVELTAGSSLADLQRVIQISLGWSDQYQHRFCIRNHYLGTSRPGGLLFFGDPEAMTISQFAFRLNERFTYAYNFFDAREAKRLCQSTEILGWQENR